MQTQSVRRTRRPRAPSSADTSVLLNPILPTSLKDRPILGTVQVPKNDPLSYGLIVKGNCMAPEIVDGDTIVVSPSTDVTVGMIVAFSFRDGRMGAVKRLTHLPRPPKPDDEVEVLIRVEMNNPPQTYFLPWSAIDKMHAVNGVVRGGEFIAIESRRAS